MNFDIPVRQTGTLAQQGSTDFLQTASSIVEPNANSALSISGGTGTPSPFDLSTGFPQTAGPLVLSGPIVATASAFNFLVTSGNFSINLEFDSAAAGAGQPFLGDIEQAASAIVADLHVARAITVNLQIQYGEQGIATTSADAAPSGYAAKSYSTVRSDLLATAASGDTNFSYLPSGSSVTGTDGSTTQNFSVIDVFSAQEKAFGMISGANSALDGTADFGTGIGTTLLVGVALHELTHALGRVPDEATPSSTPDIFDLFRFASQGTILVNPNIPASAAYFSVDGGASTIVKYGVSSDPSDFLNTQSTGSLYDPFTEYYSSSTPQNLTALDLQQMDVLGYSTACFAEGTCLATPGGTIAVEALHPGALVLTASGGVRPVRWIGYRRLDLTRHPAPEEVCPIRIRAGALGQGVPVRDLRVSPEHALFLDGGLVPARLLVNGGSILRESECRHVVWYHVELDTHDLVLAEGAPTETYLDTGNRGLFENADEPLVLHPDFTMGQAERVARSCAPLLHEPAQVEPIWRRLAERSELAGIDKPPLISTTSDPDVALEMDGRVFRPIDARDNRYVFVLPAIVGPVRLASRACAPSTLRPWIADRRQLGLCVSQLVIRSSRGERVLLPDDPNFSEGWFAIEQSNAGARRWTNGNAILPIETGHPVVIEITCRPLFAYALNVLLRSHRNQAA